jgi:hypothetical protein
MKDLTSFLQHMTKILPKGEEIIAVWQKLHNEKHHNLYFLPNNIGMIKSSTMKLVGHAVKRTEMHT